MQSHLVIVFQLKSLNTCLHFTAIIIIAIVKSSFDLNFNYINKLIII